MYRKCRLPMVDVVDTPCFVDSRYTMGIQLADLVAGVIQQYEQAELFSDPYPDDFYLGAIARYYSIVRSKTQELTDRTGTFPWHGLHRMPERLHYIESDEEAIGGAEP